jgi:NAD(P)H dehydrogenase (quinone)
MIAITGATGQLGKLTIKHLLTKVDAKNIVAIARDMQKAKDLSEKGVQVRIADYNDKEGFASALTGIETLLLISSNEIGQREPQHINVVDAARKAGVKKIVYTSILHADKNPISLAPEHLATEEYIKKSDIPYIILRNGWYTENYTASIPAALTNGTLIGSAKDGKIASAAREDYAEAAVAVLTMKTESNKTYELAGDHAYTLADLAAEISKQTGKNIPYTDLPEQEYASILEKAAGLPKDFALAIAGWDVSASQNALFGDESDLRELIGRPTTSLATSVSAGL